MDGGWYSNAADNLDSPVQILWRVIFDISAWQQHDVQELCRVMFDALELSWKHTDQANLINQLYQGRMKDYVKCLEVRKFFVPWSC